MKSLRLLSRHSRHVSTLPLRRSPLNPSNARILAASSPLQEKTAIRPFSSSCCARKGLTPDSSDPAPPSTQSSPNSASNATAADIADSEYHEIADQYLDALVLALEEKSEASDGLEVEYAAGVLTITHPRGTYVINKQPPNKQIWLSSPLSGPKRYDWVTGGSGQNEKQDSEGADKGDNEAGGKWVYLRDGSLLSDLLKKEIGVDMAAKGEADVAGGREGPGGGGYDMQ